MLTARGSTGVNHAKVNWLAGYVLTAKPGKPLSVHFRKSRSETTKIMPDGLFDALRFRT